MATTRTRRVIEIDVTTSKGAKAGIRQINSQLRSMEGAAKRTQREVTRMGRSFNLFSIAAKAFIAIRVAKAVTDISDSMILLSARVNIVAEETVGLEKAMDDLFEISTLTRQSIEATGTLYARLGFSTKTLGLAHQDLLDIVQGVNNTLLLSGSSAQESASSIIQLSQAFSKGSLDGDEFRSVSEGNVILFGIMQEVLGKTSKELRQFSRDGKLTADLLAQVLTSQQVKNLQTRVDEIPFTFGQAFTLVRNELSKLATAFEDDFASITEGIVGGIHSLTVFRRFSEAASAGLIDEPELSDIFDVEKMESELRELDAISGTYGTKIVGRISTITGKIKELDTEAAEVTKSLQEALSGASETLPFGASEDSIFGKAFRDFTGTAASDLEELKKQLNVNRGEARKLREELDLLIRPKKKEALPVFDTGAAETFSKYEESVLKAQAAFEQTLDNIIELDALFQEGRINGDVYASENEKISNSLLKMADAAGEAEEEIDKFSATMGVAIGNTLASGIGDIADSLVDLAAGLETSFRDAVEGILLDVARLITRLVLLRAVQASLANTPAGEFLFPVANADGNALNNGRVIPFASGGVIDSPMLFPMANGTGLVGEDGPEAILPLKRGADGKLGVKAEGSAPERVIVQIDNKGSDSQVTSSTASADINGTVISIVLDDLHKGGRLRDSIKGLREY